MNDPSIRGEPYPVRGGGAANRVLLLLVILLVGVGHVRGASGIPAALLIASPLVIRFASLYTLHVTLVFLAGYLIFEFISPTTPILAVKASGLALYIYVAWMIVPLRRTLDGLTVGRLSRRVGIQILVIVGCAAVALFAWSRLAVQQPLFQARLLPPQIQGIWIPVYAACFAMTNALVEEIIWRGVMQKALEAAFGPGWFAIGLQAISFGLAHYRGGFPGGWSGVMLTTLFGLVLGRLRHRTGGLAAPWLAHAAADFTIMCLIFWGR